MTGNENVKPIAKLLEAVRGVVDRDIKLGLYEGEDLRLTIEARKEAVKQLADQGLSNRQIAKAVGADEATVRRDKGAANAAKSAANAAPSKTSKPKKTEPVAHDDCEDGFLNDYGEMAPADKEADDACRIRGFLFRARESTFCAETDDLKGLVCTREMLEAAREAAAAWLKVCQLMEIQDGKKSEDQAA